MDPAVMTGGLATPHWDPRRATPDPSILSQWDSSVALSGHPISPDLYLLSGTLRCACISRTEWPKAAKDEVTTWVFVALRVAQATRYRHISECSGENVWQPDHKIIGLFSFWFNVQCPHCLSNHNSAGTHIIFSLATNFSTKVIFVVCIFV